jgi:hypothetical protein
MEIDKKLKMLQLFYAGVLADSIKNYNQAGILESVETHKAAEQKLMAGGQLAQLNINSPGEMFSVFSEIFGCIRWQISSEDNKIIATGNNCLLCSIAKKMNIPQPCKMYCINPFSAMSEKMGYALKPESTLWESDSCRFVLRKNP